MQGTSSEMSTAIILAGGQSSRLGFDKQFIRLEGRLLVDIIISKLQKHFGEIIVVTNKPEEYKTLSIMAVKDEIKGFGPLGGIHSGLRNSSSRFNYVTACDMPYINQDYVDYMISLIKGNQSADAVITRFGDWIEPFNAFYSKSLMPVIEKQVETKERKIGDMLAKARTMYIEEKKAREFSPDWNMFTNINTLDEYQKQVRDFSHT